MNNNSNKSFNDLVSKMEQLKESEQGKLKGGFSSVSGNGFSDDLGFDYGRLYFYFKSTYVQIL